MQDNNYQYNQGEPKQSGAYDCSNGTNSQYYQNPQYNQNAQYNAYYQNGQYQQAPYQNNQYYQLQYQNQQYGYSTPAQQEYANFENKLSNAKILGIISIVMAFVTPFIGIILGIIGLVNVSDVPVNYVPLEEQRKSCKMLNILGIVLPFVWVAVLIVLFALFFTTAFSTLGSMM